MKDNMQVVVNSVGDKMLVQYQEPTEYLYKGVDYELFSTSALIDLIKARGSVENTLTFYTNISGSSSMVQVILDDSIQDRRKDTALYHFKESDKLKEWGELIGKSMTQKSFIKFLKRRDPAEFMEPGTMDSLMAIAQTLNVATMINFDSVFMDNNNREVAFKIKDLESSTKIPESFEIVIPLLNDTDLLSVMEIEIELTKPKSEGEKALFSFECPRLKNYMKAAVDYEIDQLKSALPGHKIFAGKGW